jgi:hypothetical protein
LDISETHFVEFLDVVLERRDLLFQRHTDVVVSTARVQLDAVSTPPILCFSPRATREKEGPSHSPNTISSKDINHNPGNFETESTPVLNGTTILIGTLVGGVIKKLMDEITVGADVWLRSIERRK